MTTLGSLRLVIPSALALLATYATASGQCMYWDGVGMSTGRTLDMTVFDVGFGPELFATHNSAVFRWTGTSWAGIPDDFDDDPEALCGYDDGTGPTLYVAGRFTAQYWTGAPMWHIAKMSFGGWVAFGGGLPTPDPTPYINRMLVFDDGTGAQLYVAGGFTTYPNINSNNIVRWNGTAWSGVGGGLPLGVGTLTVFDDGTGPALFAYTAVSVAGGAIVGTLAKWTGTTWTMIGPGITRNGQAGSVWSLVEFDSGSGPALFAGGLFDHAGSVAANCIARWDGTNWSALPGVPLAPTNFVTSLVVHDDGNGPALYEASDDGALPFIGVARWNGMNWSALGTRPVGNVNCLQSFDDGQGGGPALYAGGDFWRVGGNQLSESVGRWFGSCTHTVDPMCFGDGTFAECPCANYGAVGSGCQNSASASGALLFHSGTTNPDTLVLGSTSEPTTSTSVFIQSAALRSVQSFLGDGILCLGGQLRRLYVSSAVAGTAQAPQPGNPSITQRSASLGDPLVPGSVRFYQVWYRDNVPYCLPGAYNISNGLRVVW